MWVFSESHGKGERREEVYTVDDEDGLCCVGGAGDVCFCFVRPPRSKTESGDGGHTCLQAIDSLVLALGLIVLGDDGGDTNRQNKRSQRPQSEETPSNSVKTSYVQQALLTPDMAADEQ
jgi:hypothetical protein